MTQFLVRNKLGWGMLTVTFTIGCVGCLASPENSETRLGKFENNIGHNTEPAEKAPAISVHIDPKTGQIITPPTKALASQIPQSSDVTTKQPFAQPQQMMSPVPGGGVMIYLDERFMTPETAIIDADGKVRVEHQPTVSGSNEKK